MSSLEKEDLVFHPKGSLLQEPNFSRSGEAPGVGYGSCRLRLHETVSFDATVKFTNTTFKLPSDYITL